MKFQIPKNKFQTNFNDQSLKFQTNTPVLVIGYCPPEADRPLAENLGFVRSLLFGAWNFRFVTKERKGFGLVEIIIVTAIMTTALAAFAQASTLALRLLRSEKDELEAVLLVEEGLEAVRSLRDESWTQNIVTLTNGTPYYPVVENSKWKLSAANPGVINARYTRTITLEGVLRSAQDRISASGTLDVNTRKVTSRVTWTGANAENRSTEAVLYITNFQEALGGVTEAKVSWFESGITDANIAAFPSANTGSGDPAQTFTTGAGAVQASRVDLFLRRAAAMPSDIYVEIRSNVTGSVLGTSNTINAASIASTALGWVEFRFQMPVSLEAATSYALRFRSTPSSTDAGSGSAGFVHWGYQQTASSPYAGGSAYRYVGRLSDPLYAGEVLTQYDYSFRVWGIQ